MKRASRRATQPDAPGPKYAEVKARSGIVKKVARTEPGTAQGRGRAALPKVTGKVVKTFVDDFTIARGRGRAVSPIVGRRQPRETP